jgi:hypothetical protein
MQDSTFLVPELHLRGADRRHAGFGAGRFSALAVSMITIAAGG